MFTNLPGDVVTNTWHFDPASPAPLETIADLLTPRLGTLYSAIYTSTKPMGPYMLPNLAEVHWYDLSAPPPRAPYIVPMVNTITIGAGALPTEVACVLSFQADQVSGIPQARRRGRIFLGALGTSWMTGGTGAAFPVFTPAHLTGIATALETFHANVQVDGADWTVWSPTDGSASQVTNGWIDNSPDTQRRRSVDPTARTLWAG
jgi:hypothetical protein